MVQTGGSCGTGSAVSLRTSISSLPRLQLPPADRAIHSQAPPATARPAKLFGGRASLRNSSWPAASWLSPRDLESSRTALSDGKASPAHGAADGPAEGLLSSVQRAQLHEWVKCFDDEKHEYRSFALYCEYKLAQAARNTTHLGAPNRIRTAVAFEIFEKMTALLKRYTGVLTKLHDELTTSVYHNPPKAGSGGEAEATVGRSAVPFYELYDAVARSLKDKEELYAAREGDLKKMFMNKVQSGTHVVECIAAFHAWRMLVELEKLHKLRQDNHRLRSLVQTLMKTIRQRKPGALVPTLTTRAGGARADHVRRPGHAEMHILVDAPHAEQEAQLQAPLTGRGSVNSSMRTFTLQPLFPFTPRAAPIQLAHDSYASLPRTPPSEVENASSGVATVSFAHTVVSPASPRTASTTATGPHFTFTAADVANSASAEELITTSGSTSSHKQAGMMVQLAGDGAALGEEAEQVDMAGEFFTNVLKSCGKDYNAIMNQVGDFVDIYIRHHVKPPSPRDDHSNEGEGSDVEGSGSGVGSPRKNKDHRWSVAHLMPRDFPCSIAPTTAAADDEDGYKTLHRRPPPTLVHPSEPDSDSELRRAYIQDLEDTRSKVLCCTGQAWEINDIRAQLNNVISGLKAWDEQQAYGPHRTADKERSEQASAATSILERAPTMDRAAAAKAATYATPADTHVPRSASATFAAMTTSTPNLGAVRAGVGESRGVLSRNTSFASKSVTFGPQPIPGAPFDDHATLADEGAAGGANPPVRGLVDNSRGRGGAAAVGTAGSSSGVAREDKEAQTDEQWANIENMLHRVRKQLPNIRSSIADGANVEPETLSLLMAIVGKPRVKQRAPLKPLTWEFFLEHGLTFSKSDAGMPLSLLHSLTSEMLSAKLEGAIMVGVKAAVIWTDMADFVCSFLLQKYGLRPLAMTTLRKFAVTLWRERERDWRANMFAQMCGIVEPSEPMLLQLYVEGLLVLCVIIAEEYRTRESASTALTSFWRRFGDYSNGGARISETQATKWSRRFLVQRGVQDQLESFMQHMRSAAAQYKVFTTNPGDKSTLSVVHAETYLLLLIREMLQSSGRHSMTTSRDPPVYSSSFRRLAPASTAPHA